MLSQTIPALLIAAIGVHGLQLPRLTGQYPVGIVDLELTDESRLDPLAPAPQPRDLMLSVFYPTSLAAVKSGNYSFAPYLSPKTVGPMGMYFGTSEEVASLVTQTYHGAPITSNDFPVLIFSPGMGGSRLMYAAHLAEIASQGWIIFAVDHPYDAEVVEFPSGKVVLTIPSLLDDFPSKMPGLVEIRVADVEFVTKAIQNSTVWSRVPGLITAPGGKDAFSKGHVGIFGGSLGGATAAEVMARTTTYACGGNFDGAIFGPIPESPFRKPFLQLETVGHNLATDDSFAAFFNHSGRYLREFAVNGTVHLSFTDVTLVRDLVGDAFPVDLRNKTGTIAGKRLLEIDTTLVDTFFAICLKGKPADELDKLVRFRYPEVSIPSYNASTTYKSC